MSSYVRVPLFTLLAASLAVSGQAQELREDIEYARVGDRPLKLDLVLPADEQEMRPAIMCIHGGGWRGGSRKRYHAELRKFAEAGYVAASIEYRLSGEAVWPAQIDDVRAAFQWLIRHANELGIDPHRIGVLGGSAGGHLSLMLGLLPAESDSTVRPAAIFNYFGPTELRNVEKIKHGRAMVEGLIGGRLEDSAKKLAAVSPVVFVDRTDPPVLTFQGTADPLVHFEQAQILHEALNKVQVPNALFPMEGAGHGIGGDIAKLTRTRTSFADAYLRVTKQPLLFHENFDSDLAAWQPTDDSAWKLVKSGTGSHVSLVKKRSDYEPEVRSPYNILLLREHSVTDFVLDVAARSTNKVYGHQDLCLIFGYQDPSHFYYVHLGREADAHANSIFLVNGAPRVSIAKKRTEGTDWSRGWHRIRVRRDVAKATIEVYFDDMLQPVMTTVDNNFLFGRIGIGSFDDTGDFDTVRLWGRREE